MAEEFPRILHALWFDGDTDQRPACVQHCLSRWQALNPEYELRLLDKDAALQVLEGFPIPLDQIAPQALSDILRAKLLLEQGGVWVDASLYPVQPLQTWLPERLQSSGFFAFKQPGQDRPLASWFLAAAPGHVALQGWWEEICRFWNQPRRFAPEPLVPEDPVAAVASEHGDALATYPYFWFHYLFDLMLQTRPDVRDIWARSASLPAGPPHRLQQLCRQVSEPSAGQVMNAMQGMPVQKLDWRQPYPFTRIEQSAAEIRQK